MGQSNDERPWAHDDLATLIAEAKAGSTEALGRLVECCRPYLLLIANQDLDPKLRAKLGASDIVQETLITAQQEISQFHGGTEPELLAWLRGILANDLLEHRRKFSGTAKRQVNLEVPLSGASAGDQPIIDVTSRLDTPSTEAALREQAERLGQALSRLPGDWQRVVRLRNWEQLSFEDIGVQLNRSAEAARKLWSRAIARLEQELDGHD